MIKKNTATPTLPPATFRVLLIKQAFMPLCFLLFNTWEGRGQKKLLFHFLGYQGNGWWVQPHDWLKTSAPFWKFRDFQQKTTKWLHKQIYAGMKPQYFSQNVRIFLQWEACAPELFENFVLLNVFKWIYKYNWAFTGGGKWILLPLRLSQISCSPYFQSLC